MTKYEDFKGLTSKEATLSAEKSGKNRVTRKKRHSFFKQFISSFNDPIIKILLGTLLINALFWIKDFDPYEAVGIVSAILISTFISALSEYGSEGAFLSLLEESEKCTCSVIRDGKISSLPPSELVCGDIVLLIPGEKIHADGVIVHGKVTVNQSALNGESKEVIKMPSDGGAFGGILSQNTLLSGTLICEGDGLMQIKAVGDGTYYGKIAGELQTKGAESPLKEKLSVLARSISKLGFFSAFLVAFADLFNAVIIDNSYSKELIFTFLSSPEAVMQALLHAVTLALTVVIVAVPEGLPMMIGVVLSANIKKMKKDNVLVRKPVGIETAGCMNILFTDKTGTLTYGKPTVSDFIMANGDVLPFSAFKQTDAYKLFSCCSILTSSCKRTDGEAVGGNNTDRAVFSVSDEKYSKDYTTVKTVEFTSKRKYSSATAVKNNKKRTFYKGAYEVLFSKCTHGIDRSGNVVKIDKAFSDTVKQFAENSGRILLLAYSDESDCLTLICAVNMKDGLRREAKSSVKRLQKAGVDVVMITGDGPDTAKSIAVDSGILFGKRRKIVTGVELSGMTDDEIKKELPSIAAVARAYPEDKSRLVKICMSEGLVAAMTGDGINDSPALKHADVGFAPGSSASVAKEASDIIILDDNISSVTKAVLYGRTILKNIKKFLMFQLTMNFCAVAVSLFAPLIGCETPVTVLQMLWINIIMDTLAGLAFATEEAREEYMSEPPTGKNERILTKPMIVNILYSGIICVVIMLWYLLSDFVYNFFSGHNTEFYCGFFGLFVFLGVFNCFNVRTHRLNLFSHITKNKLFIPIISAVVGVQLLLMYFGGSIFRCAVLNFRQISFVLLLSSLIIPLDMIRKLFSK